MCFDIQFVYAGTNIQTNEEVAIKLVSLLAPIFLLIFVKFVQFCSCILSVHQNIFVHDLIVTCFCMVSSSCHAFIYLFIFCLISE